LRLASSKAKLPLPELSGQPQVIATIPLRAVIETPLAILALHLRSQLRAGCPHAGPANQARPTPGAVAVSRRS